MPKRMFLLSIIIVLLIIGVGFTTIDSSSIQSDMNNFEDALTNSGVNSVIDNSSVLGDIAIKIQSIIDFIISTIMSFFTKLINIFS
ncbi:MAG: hypothetical protein R3Y60_04315 [bacterium]